MHSTAATSYCYRIHYKELNVIWKLSTLFLKHIPFDHENLVFCCIGTDRSTGDALGPLVGTQLSEYQPFPFHIIGTLDQPLHALNLEEQMNLLSMKQPNAFIVAIDACLGNRQSIGQFLFQNEALQPGKATGKNLLAVGDIALKGIVNTAGFMENAVLQSTRLSVSFSMSRILSHAIILAYRRHLFLTDRHSTPLKSM